MIFDLLSFGVGITVAAIAAASWQMGRQSAIRECRRIVRHGRNLDLVYFEDAEGDPTIERPKPATAEVTHLRESQR